MTSRAAAIAVSTAAATDLSGGASLGLGDALLGQTLAARQRLIEIAGRLRGEPFGFLPGVRDDCFRLGRRLVFPTPIIGQQMFCFVAQLAGLVEFVADADRALVECAGDRAGGRLPDQGDQDHQRDQHPEMVIVQQLAHRAGPGENIVYYRGDPRLARGGAGQLFDDRPADIDRDPAHIGERLLLCRGDAALGFVHLLGRARRRGRAAARPLRRRAGRRFP